MSDLEALLREALRDQAARPRRNNPFLPPPTTFLPADWRLGRLISLIHPAADLGVYREHFHIRTGARRLERSEGTAEAIERVFGPAWLGLACLEPLPESPEDKAAIRAYLSRRRTAEVKDALTRIRSADDLLRELDEEEE